jgi:hypothetical protein
VESPCTFIFWPEYVEECKGLISVDELVVEISKAKKGLNVFDFAWF